MKKNLLKIVSLSLTLCMIFCLAIPVFTVSATEAEETTPSTNLIAGMVPYKAYHSEVDSIGKTTYATLEIPDTGTATRNYHPFFEGMYHVKPALEPYLSTLTDADTESGYSYAVTLSGRNLTFIYDLGEKCGVDSFSVDFSDMNSVSNAGLKAHIFASETEATLFNQELESCATEAKGKKLEVNLNTVARYVAVVFENNGTYYVKIKNLAFNGAKLDNVIAGKLPTALFVSKKDSTVIDWQTFDFTTPEGTINTNGYKEDWAFDHFETLASYTSAITDGVDNPIQFTPANLSNTGRGMVIVYELESVCDIYNVNITSNGSYQGDIDIYASASRSDLFSGTSIGNVKWVTNLADGFVSGPSVNVTGKNVRYVGFHLKECYSNRIGEISVYGNSKNENINNNLIKGKKPVAMYAARQDTLNFSWITEINLNNKKYDSFGRIKPQTVDYPELNYLTDGYTITSVPIKNHLQKIENDVDVNKAMAVVYQLDSLSEVNAVEFEAGSPLRNADIYMSRGYASLFRADSKVASFVSDGTSTKHTFELATPKQTVYVGIILDTDYFNPYNLSEIRVCGKEVQNTVNDIVIGKSLAPVNESANAETKSFYQYLNNVGESENVLIGAHINKEEQLAALSNNNNYYNFIEKRYGVSPAIVSLGQEMGTDAFVQYYNQGAIPMVGILGALWNMKCFGSEEGQLNIQNTTSFIKYLDKTYVPSQAEVEIYYAMQAEYGDYLTAAADFLSELETNGVKTYIVRPFNEMNVHGFFGDAQNDATVYFKNVWQQMVDFFVNEAGLKGILFAYTPANITDDRSQTIMSLYPGDDYVDIIAPTVYSLDNSGSLTPIPDYDEILESDRPFGLAEIGILQSYESTKINDCLDLLISLKTTFKEASFASLWFGNYGIDRHLNNEAFIYDDYIITVDKMVDHQHQNVQPIACASLSDSLGNKTKFALGEYSADILSNLSVNAIDLYDGIKVTVYAEDNCTGESFIFGRDVADLSKIDVTLSSVKFEKAEKYTVADINSDSNINLTDLVALKKDIANSEYRNSLASDIDNNGRVNISDVVSLRKILLGVNDI